MRRYCFGVDLGGTTVKLGLFDLDGDIVDKWEIPTVLDNAGTKILPDIARSILQKMDARGMDREDVLGVGIGAPGPVDSEGTIYGAVNLGWGTFNLKKELQSFLNMPVEGGNDANVAALGEMWQGGARGYKDIVLVTLGTGVGGGIINDGKIVTGAHGAGGEIGHIHVTDSARRKLAADERPSVMRRDGLSAKDVWDAVKADDPLALEVAEDFGWYLGKALAGVASVVNPETFVIGGGVSKAGGILLDYTQKYFRQYAFSACRGTLFTLARLGNDAGIYGAARMVLD